MANYNESSSETQALSNQSAITVTDAEITQVSFQYDEGTTSGSRTRHHRDRRRPGVPDQRDRLTCLAHGTDPLQLLLAQRVASGVGDREDRLGVVGGDLPVDDDPDRGRRLHLERLHRRRATARRRRGAASRRTARPGRAARSRRAFRSSPTSSVRPSATTPACFAIGDEHVVDRGAPHGHHLGVAPPPGPRTPFPTHHRAQPDLVCPSSTAQPLCFVIGTNSSGAIDLLEHRVRVPGDDLDLLHPKRHDHEHHRPRSPATAPRSVSRSAPGTVSSSSCPSRSPSRASVARRSPGSRTPTAASR